MTYAWEQIRSMVRLMQNDQGPVMAQMRDILIRYEGNWIVPLPAVKNEPKLPQLTPALIGEAIDQLALRASSVMPGTKSPPIDRSVQSGPRSTDFATRRGGILRATDEISRWPLGMRRYYRHLTAYHTAAMVAIPDMREGVIRKEVRDPLSAYCEPRAAESLVDPCYGAFVNRYSGTYLRDKFEKARDEYGGPISKLNVTDLWDVIEWYDEEECVWGLMGPTDSTSQTYTGNIYGNPAYLIQGGMGPSMELARLPNRAGCLPMIMPHNVSLSRICSRIGQMIGNVDLQAKLTALHITAQEKSIFPDTYAIGRQNETPALEGGSWKPGIGGDINLVSGADQIGVLRTTPDPMTGQIIDRLERNFRVGTGLLPQMGGETYGALRTGRGIDALSGIALDPRIQEMHEITEGYFPKLNRAVLGSYKGYFGSKSFSMYYAKATKLVEFTPDTHIETLENSVTYRWSGADIMQLTQILGSLFGAGMIATESVMEAHPFIDDSVTEIAKIREEQMEKAMTTGLAQQIMAGQLNPMIAAMYVRELRDGTDAFEAMENVQKKIQTMQATQAPPPEQGQIAAPEQMPGLSAGPAALQQPGAEPANVNVPPDLTRMRQLMRTLANQTPQGAPA